MEKPLVSVILPAYNTGMFLNQTIDSILNQTYANIELIVVDDCSTDDTWNTILKYASIDDRIRAIHLERNMHVCNAGNQGYKIARGKYIALIGHDDYWEYNKIQEQVDALERDKTLCACFTFSRFVDENGCLSSKIFQVISDENIERLQDFKPNDYIEYIFWKGNFLPAPSALIKKEAIDKAYGGKYMYKPSLLQRQDHFLWLEILKYGGFKFIEKPLLYYRFFGDTGKNLSAYSPEKQIRTEHECVIEEARYIKKLENELFINVFGSYFENEDAKSEVEIEYEKAMIIYKKKNQFCVEMLYSIMDEEENWEILEKKYNFSLMKLYEISTESFHFDNSNSAEMTKLYNVCSEQKELISEYEKVIKKQMDLIVEMTSK